MADPPSSAGAFHVRATWLSPPRTESPVGMPGRLAAAAAGAVVVGGAAGGVVDAATVGDVGDVEVDTGVASGRVWAGSDVVVDIGIGPDGGVGGVDSADGDAGTTCSGEADLRGPAAAAATGPECGPVCAAPNTAATATPVATTTPAAN
jgi:hypothetical protein